MQVECACGKLVDVPDAQGEQEPVCPECGSRLQPSETVDMMGDPVDEVEESLPIAHDADEEPLPVALDAPPPSSRSSLATAVAPVAPPKPGPLSILVLAAGVVLLILIVTVVALNSGGSSGSAHDPNDNYRQQLNAVVKPPTVEAPPTIQNDAGTGGGFFSNVPDGRTSKDYERERQQKLNGGR
ncbi:MAG TPA: hypothetical protein PLP01_03735 [Phycisphaerae bacterium]|nr:hypothetical protein [Phycisphaerae bacterium]